MKYFALAFFGLLFLSSCNEFYRARQISGIAGGRNTSYTGEFQLRTDSIQGNIMDKVYEVFGNKGYNLSRETESQLVFEDVSSSLGQQTTGKNKSGTFTITHFPQDTLLKINMRLRGNYGYGTKEKALKILEESRYGLYDIEPPTKKSKKKKNNEEDQ